MAFKGLSDRFEARMNEIYGNRSNRVEGSDQPYLEVKPNDPDRRSMANDSQSMPIGATKRDIKRISAFLKSNRGLLFLGKQQLLQTGNSIAESRIINPTFVIGNAVPFLHLSRTLRSPADYQFNGEEGISPVSMESKIGHAGRMQKSTARAAVSNITGTKGLSGLLGLLPVGQLIETVTGTLMINDGATGVNERPEMNVGGELYSIRLWKGIGRQRSIEDDIRQIQSSIRTGNIRGIVNGVRNTVNNTIRIANDTLGTINRVTGGGLSDMEGRNRPWSTEYYGRRYFITSLNTADRYLKDHGGSASSLLSDISLRIEPFAILGNSPSLMVPTFSFDLQSVGNVLGGAARKVGFTSTKRDSFNIPSPVSSETLRSIAGAKGFAAEANARMNDGNAVLNNKFTFPSASVQAHYTDESHLQYIKEQLDVQKKNQFDYWQKQLPLAGARSLIVGGLTPGSETDFKPNERNPHVGGYKDLKNTGPAFLTGVDSNHAVKIARDKTGDDFINVVFYDVTNKTAVPFRALVANITQQISTEITDTRYIGRTERNVVYTGATRDVNFQLYLHAFSPDELKNVWTKADYLTGLCFPATYNNGFMVPPLVRLTIGNMYYNQPGFIRSLTHTVEDGTSWELTDGAQVPHGLTINVGFSIIEKTAMTAKGVASGQVERRFFGFGNTTT